MNRSTQNPRLRTARHLSLTDLFVLGLIIIAASFFAVGFFFDDPILTGPGSQGIHRLMALTLRTAGILSVPVLAALYLCVRWRRLSAANLLIAALAVLATALVSYPVFIEFFYSKTQGALKANFHPYLQIKPPPFELRTKSEKSQPLRIVCLGGSTTARPDSRGRRWTEMLEERLTAQCLECNVEVYNQGMDWYTSLHSLINYATNVRASKPDIVIVMHAANDLMHNFDFSQLSNGAFRNDYGHYLGPVVRLIQRGGPLAEAYGHFRKHWFAPERRYITLKTFPGLQPFRQNLMTMRGLAVADGAELVLMTEAYLYRSDLTQEERQRLSMYNFEAHGMDVRLAYESIERGMKEYDDTIRELAVAGALPLIDLERAIPKTLEYFDDDVHFTDRAFPIVAAAIEEKVLPLVRSRARREAG